MEASLAPALGPGEHRRTFLSSFRVAQVAFVPRTPDPRTPSVPQVYFTPLCIDPSSNTFWLFFVSLPFSRKLLCTLNECVRNVCLCVHARPGGHVCVSASCAYTACARVAELLLRSATAAFINIKQILGHCFAQCSTLN